MDLFVNFVFINPLNYNHYVLMAAFVAQASEEGFSKLQIFMQQLIDWGVGAGGRIIGAVIIFVVGRFLISFIKKLVSKLLMKRHIDAGIQSFVIQFLLRPIIR